MTEPSNRVPDGPSSIAAPMAGAGPRPWREAWSAWRNRRLASPGFQRWALRFPLTRGTARRHVRALFDLVAGFVYTQTLSACVELGVFDLLRDGPQSLVALAPRLSLSVAAADRLLKAAAALDLVEALGAQRYGLGPLGAALLGTPGVSAMIAHHALLYADLADPVALLRGDVASPQLAQFWAYARHADPAGVTPDRVDAYSALMGVSQAMIAGEILDAYPFARHRRLLDIGGGEGVFLTAAGRRCPRLALMLFDLPAVAARARERLGAAGLSARTSVFEGSFFADPVPAGADLVTLIRVLHDHDDDAVLSLLRRLHTALSPGAVLLVAEPMSGTPGAHATGDAYFGFYLAAMGSGRPRTVEELSDLLGRAGFRRIRPLRTHTPLLVRLIAASI